MDRKALQELIDRYAAVSFTVNRRLNSMIRELLHEDLTHDQFSVLHYLQKRGSCNSSELSDIFCVGKSSITAIITRLADKGLLERKPDSKDRRIVHLALTPEGKRATEEIRERIESLIASYLVHFDEAEVQSFITTYEKLAQLILQDEGGETKA